MELFLKDKPIPCGRSTTKQQGSSKGMCHSGRGTSSISWLSGKPKLLVVLVTVLPPQNKFTVWFRHEIASPKGPYGKDSAPACFATGKWCIP